MASLTLDQDATLQNPTNKPINSEYFTIKVTNTGTYTLSYGSDYKWVDGSEPIISQKSGANNKVDILGFYCDGTSMYGTINQDFS